MILVILLGLRSRPDPAAESQAVLEPLIAHYVAVSRKSGGSFLCVAP